MLEHRGGVLRLDVGNRVRTALVANQQRVARGEIARACRLAVCRHKSAIGVVGMSSGDTLGNDPAGRVLTQVDHLGSRVDLLIAV